MCGEFSAWRIGLEFRQLLGGSRVADRGRGLSPSAVEVVLSCFSRRIHRFRYFFYFRVMV